MKKTIFILISIVSLLSLRCNYSQTYVLNESKYSGAINLMFSFQMKEAIAKLDSLIVKDDDDPTIYFLRGVVYYYTSLIQKNEISDGLYSSDFLKNEFDKNIAKAIEIGKRLISIDPNNYSVALILGACYGYQGLFFLNQDEFMSGYKKGREGYKVIQSILEKNNNFQDAYLGIGLYNIFTSYVPWYVRWLISSGDKEEGIKQMLMVIDQAKFNFTKYFAMIYLENFYYLEYRDTKDKNMLHARINVINNFLIRYPHNFAMKLDLASCYEIANPDSAVKLYLNVIDYARGKNNVQLLNFTLYSLGQLYWEMKNSIQAVVCFNTVINNYENESALKERSKIKLAEIIATTGDKKKAVQLLDEVILKTTDKKIKENAEDLKNRLD